MRLTDLPALPIGLRQYGVTPLDSEQRAALTLHQLAMRDAGLDGQHPLDLACALQARYARGDAITDEQGIEAAHASILVPRGTVLTVDTAEGVRLFDLADWRVSGLTLSRGGETVTLTVDDDSLTRRLS